MERGVLRRPLADGGPLADEGLVELHLAFIEGSEGMRRSEYAMLVTACPRRYASWPSCTAIGSIAKTVSTKSRIRGDGAITPQGAQTLSPDQPACFPGLQLVEPLCPPWLHRGGQ